MKKIILSLGLWLVLLLSPQDAEAQSQRNPCYYATSTSTGCTSVSGTNPLPVSASVSVSGFAPTTTGTPISVTTGGVTGTLPAGAVVAAFNVGTTNTAYCKLGASATTSDIAIPPASWFAFTVGASTQLTCITSTSTTTVNMVGGSGIPSGAGGGGSAQVTDPCKAVTKLYKAFSQTATAVLVSGTSSKKTYVCSIAIIAGAAEIFNLTAGTGSTCGTNTVAVLGSTTAANGLSLAANGGITLGNGDAALAATTVNADDLCLQQSGSNRLSGGITYVQL